MLGNGPGIEHPRMGYEVSLRHDGVEDCGHSHLEEEVSRWLLSTNGCDRVMGSLGQRSLPQAFCWSVEGIVTHLHLVDCNSWRCSITFRAVMMRCAAKMFVFSPSLIVIPFLNGVEFEEEKSLGI